MIGSVCASKAVEKFDIRQRKRKHREKILAAKSTINTIWSTREQGKLIASRTNPKRNLSYYERSDEIEKENTRLLLRFFEIGEHKPPPPLPAKNSTSEPKDSAIPPVRKREIQRINAENVKLLKRIQGVKPCIDHAVHLEDSKRNRHIMQLRCEYQPDAGRRNSTLNAQRSVHTDNSACSSARRSVENVVLPALTPTNQRRTPMAGAMENDSLFENRSNRMFEDKGSPKDESDFDGGEEVDYDKCIIYGAGTG